MIVLDKNNFNSEVLEASGWVLVDYSSPQCMPCKALKPHVEKLQEKYGEQIKFCELDITKARRLAIQQGVMALPVIAFYLGGEKKDELKGKVTPKLIKDKIKELLG